MVASVKYINQSMCRVNQRINVWVSGEVSLQLLQFIANVAIRANFTTDNTIDEYWEMAAQPLCIGFDPSGID
jgi:hypothetical protein